MIHASSSAQEEAATQPAGSPATFRDLNLPELHPLDGAAAEGSYTDVHEFLCPAQPSLYGAQFLANWLIPNRVLVGRYPFLEPSQCSKRKHGEQQINTLLKAGVTTFVCLQKEIPAQKDIPQGGASTPSGIFHAYKPIASMMYSSMGAPPSVDITGTIRTSQLDQFLPPRRSSSPKPSQPTADRRELEFLYSPITDLGVPSTEQVRSLVNEVIARLAKGEVLYIHCWGGRGRAGTVGACLLKTVYGIDSEVALRRVQMAFKARRDADISGTPRTSPETEEQREFVRKYVH